MRSQDKKQLAQIVGLLLDDENNEIRGFTNYHQNYYELGTYATKERALEILDEIAAMIKNRYIVKPAGIISTKDIVNEHIRLNRLYNEEFIVENPPFEIEPINSNIIYYEMPKE